MAWSYEQSCEPPGFLKGGEFLDQLNEFAAFVLLRIIFYLYLWLINVFNSADQSDEKLKLQ
jgi:hypothetical protein